MNLVSTSTTPVELCILVVLGVIVFLVVIGGVYCVVSVFIENEIPPDLLELDSKALDKVLTAEARQKTNRNNTHTTLF